MANIGGLYQITNCNILDEIIKHIFRILNKSMPVDKYFLGKMSWDVVIVDIIFANVVSVFGAFTNKNLQECVNSFTTSVPLHAATQESLQSVLIICELCWN
jgi:hypothetical protein